MANRTMLIAASGVPSSPKDESLKTIGLSEFAHETPLIYEILVSGNPQACYSTVFNNDIKLAIAGDAATGLERLKQVHAGLPKDSDNAVAIAQVIAFLSKPHNQYPYYLLEPAEVISMETDKFEAPMAQALKACQTFDMENRLTAAQPRDWGQGCWSNVLYYLPRGAVAPPKDINRSWLTLTPSEVITHKDALLANSRLENLTLNCTEEGFETLSNCFDILATLKTPCGLKLEGKAETLPDIFAPLSMISGLNLMAMGLTSIPPSIVSLTQLESLYINSNALTEVPEDIAALTRLTNLSVDNNQISVLPDALGTLSQMEVLVIHNNNLTDIPDSLRGLTNLRVLRMGSNVLGQIPDVVFTFSSLQELFAPNIGLTSVPEGLAGLRSLKTLGLSQNPLGPKLRGKLKGLKSLGSIMLDNCGLTLFPKDLCAIPELKRIDLRQNTIGAIPECITKKPLDWIGLQGNPHGQTRETFNAKAIGL